MSFLERIETRPVARQASRTKDKKPSKWRLIRGIVDCPETFQLRIYFEGNGITAKIEPRGDYS